MIEIKIKPKEANQKAFSFVKKYLNDVPLSLIYKTFRKKDVKVNGKWVKEDYILKENDLMRIYLNSEIKPQSITQSKINFKVLYEDENLLAVDKPTNLLVVEDAKEKVNTLANQVLTYLYNKGEYDPNDLGFKPSPLHRIDRNTSGIVLFGKNIKTTIYFQELFKTHQGINKSYLALVKGKCTFNGEINAPLLKDSQTNFVKVSKNGLESISFVEPLKYFKDTTLVLVTIKTGRTHQIRVHMSYIGYPLVGDSKYGDFKFNKEFKSKYHLDNQLLVAAYLSFDNLRDDYKYLENIKITSSMPNNYQKIIDELERSK